MPIRAQSRANNYSDKEKLLFAHYGLDDLLDHLDAVTLYRMAVNKAFMMNDQGAYADSLRRCVQALDSCTAYRFSPQWEEMIQI